MAVQEIRWDKGGSELVVDDYTFFYGNADHHLGTGFLVHNGILSAIKRVELVSDRLSYITLRGYWCDIIVLNVHAQTEDKCDDTKDSCYEELEYSINSLKYNMKILLDFNEKVEREDISKPTIGKESLHETSNENGDTVVHFATLENLAVKNALLHHKIHKYT
jgi:hypothetical protein